MLEFAAAPERALSAAEIAARYGASPHHLAKVLRAQGRAGLLSAARGVGGGYRFRGNAKRLTLLDVIDLFENIGRGGGARGRGRSGRDIEHAIDTVLVEIDETARATFGSITLETMLKLAARPRTA
ncbi:MAG: Rrf2 family transcriptional regulator [Proteobacteria bacterium]|nr:Rrf2 family transcriptional regulator [Pseudomonadota bacterium]